MLFHTGHTLEIVMVVMYSFNPCVPPKNNACTSCATLALCDSRNCELGEIVQGDEGPVSEVAQVVCHGVIVVGGHREEGQEEEGEKQGEVEREVEQLRDNRTCAWREDGMTDSRDLEPSGM